LKSYGADQAVDSYYLLKYCKINKLKLKIMECPICKVTLLMSDKQGVEIDYCPTCRGVWLDRGELEKIIERSYMPAGRQEMPPTDERLYSDKSHDSHDSYKYDSHGYKDGRKKNFLSELFD
jgi:Zn-finger nucleic acid-binding protein